MESKGDQRLGGSVGDGDKSEITRGINVLLVVVREVDVEATDIVRFEKAQLVLAM